MRLERLKAIADVRPDEWNRLTDNGTPFIRHEYLAALESTGCAGPATGWHPQHLLLRDDNGSLLGAMPAWLKTHSRGEFVFDFIWAEAWERHGLPYYPKLVSAIPFTPVPGLRLLVAPEADATRVRSELIAATTQHAQAQQLSSAHWLFPNDTDRAQLQEAGLLLRKNVRFVWRNRDYGDFENYLQTFTASRRKKIRRERRRIQEQGLRLEVRHGNEVDPALWQTLWPLYASSHYLRGQQPYLSQTFFERLCAELGATVVLFIALDGEQPVACAITLRDGHSLYGRHWGSARDYHSLHFETCYYRPLEYCLEHGLTHFDPGTQGEHKLSRGFLPEAAWSAHWIAHPDFRRAIADFLDRETSMVDEYLVELTSHSPFRHTDE